MNAVTLDADRAAIFPAGTKLRPLRDRLLVRPLEWNPSVIITAIRHGRPLRGVIDTVGPGRLYRRYRPHPTDSRKRQYVETAHFIPTEVKPGDIIELGGLNIFDGQGYNFPQVIIGTERFLICQEQDVCFVHEAEPSSMLMTQTMSRAEARERWPNPEHGPEITVPAGETPVKDCS